MHHIDDPNLQALEARLAALTPPVSGAQRQELLYESAFAAGRSVGGKATRRWQAATVALVVLMLGMSVPLVHDRMQLARLEHQQPQPPSAPTAPAPPLLAEVPRDLMPPPVKVQTDAWQIEHSSTEALSANLSQLQQIDPTMRPLAVATMTRSLLPQ